MEKIKEKINFTFQQLFNLCNDAAKGHLFKEVKP